MALPGEGDQGARHNQLTDEAYLDILERMDQAGWISAGGWGDDLQHNVGIVRMEGRSNLSPEEAAARLGISDEAGQLLDGYEVKTDEESGQLALGYEGPGDERFVQFLEGVITLGRELDEAAIQVSPYPNALENWLIRYLLWANRDVYQALEPRLSEELKAVRDHVVIEENGVPKLVGLAETCAKNEGDQWTGTSMKILASEVTRALDFETPAEVDYWLNIALREADRAIRRIVEAKEIGALKDPQVAEAFIQEILADKPHSDSEPLTEDELGELLAFEDGPKRSRIWKLTQFAKVLYYTHRGLTPQGIKMKFGEEVDLLGGKSPRDVIDRGTIEENQQLYDWAARSR